MRQDRILAKQSGRFAGYASGRKGKPAKLLSGAATLMEGGARDVCLGSAKGLLVGSNL